MKPLPPASVQRLSDADLLLLIERLVREIPQSQSLLAQARREANRRQKPAGDQ